MQIDLDDNEQPASATMVRGVVAAMKTKSGESPRKGPVQGWYCFTHNHQLKLTILAGNNNLEEPVAQFLRDEKPVLTTGQIAALNSKVGEMTRS